MTTPPSVKFLLDLLPLLADEPLQHDGDAVDGRRDRSNEVVDRADDAARPSASATGLMPTSTGADSAVGTPPTTRMT